LFFFALATDDHISLSFMFFCSYGAIRVNCNLQTSTKERFLNSVEIKIGIKIKNDTTGERESRERERESRGRKQRKGGREKVAREVT
jgi:hypothetical protein